ncbi:MAG TPA: septum formation inhibitor Maf [Clostridium sp.]|nr:septum formation inhibitor Maf [Clostridium sp.]
MKIILASASERRQELLSRVFEKFDIMVSDFDESTVVFNNDVAEYVKEISNGKALEVKERITDDAIIISADTVVTFNGKILGKPKDKNEAFQMLKSLQGGSHIVYTGITVINTKKDIVKQESVATEVTFSKISDDEIKKYIETGEPLDKAGAYGIQGKGGVFVEKINGCYYNVVGLPLNRLKAIIEEIR